MKGKRPKLEVVKQTDPNTGHRTKAEQYDPIIGIGALEPPDHLTPIERTLWDHIVRSLPAGVLARADCAIMERMVVSWSRWRECDRVIKEDGLMVATVNGWVKHPLIATLTATAKEMGYCGGELGLSPVARQRIMAGKVDPDDEMSWLMNGTR